MPGTEIYFTKICEFLEHYRQQRKKRAKENLIKKFLNHLKTNNLLTTRNISHLLHLILPSENREPKFKRRKLAKIYARTFCIPRDTPEVQNLKNKDTSFEKNIHYLLRNRIKNKNNSTKIEEITNFIKNENSNFLCELNLLEHKYLCSIILKNQFVSVFSFLQSLHPKAPFWLNSCANLSMVGDAVLLNCDEPDIFVVGEPFKPMLCKRGAKKMIENYGRRFEEKVYVEPKYDGERIQLHKINNLFKYFSRNCNDFSVSFDVTLTPFISEAFSADISTCVLDGEMIGHFEGNLVPKNEGIDVKSGTTTQTNPCYLIFDMIYLNNHKLNNLTLKERKNILESSIKSIPGRIELTEYSLMKPGDCLVGRMGEMVERGYEGVVVKLVESGYRFNCRDSEWIKLKPDYLSETAGDLDLAVVGGFLRKMNLFKISKLVLAVCGGNLPLTAISTVSLKRLSRKNIFKIMLATNNHWGGDTWYCDWGGKVPERILPLDLTLVVTVRAAGFVRSDKFPVLGSTLRFPRIEAVRFDKTWRDCMTIGEMRDLLSNSRVLSAVGVGCKDEGFVHGEDN